MYRLDEPSGKRMDLCSPSMSKDRTGWPSTPGYAFNLLKKKDLTPNSGVGDL